MPKSPEASQRTRRKSVKIAPFVDLFSIPFKEAATLLADMERGGSRDAWICAHYPEYAIYSDTPSAAVFWLEDDLRNGRRGASPARNQSYFRLPEVPSGEERTLDNIVETLGDLLAEVGADTPLGRLRLVAEEIRLEVLREAYWLAVSHAHRREHARGGDALMHYAGALRDIIEPIPPLPESGGTRSHD